MAPNGVFGGGIGSKVIDMTKSLKTGGLDRRSLLRCGNLKVKSDRGSGGFNFSHRVTKGMSGAYFLVGGASWRRRRVTRSVFRPRSRNVPD